MTGVLADDADHVVAADDLAGFAKAFDGGSDFHAGNQRRDGRRGMSVMGWA